MNMKKKLLSLSLAAMMTVSLAACGGSSDINENGEYHLDLHLFRGRRLRPLHPQAQRDHDQRKAGQ